MVDPDEGKLQTMTREEIAAAKPTRKRAPSKRQERFVDGTWQWPETVPAEVPTDGPDGDPLLFTDQVAAMVGLDSHTWRKYVKAGTAPCADDEDLDRPPGRRMRRWRKSRIEFFMNNRIGQGRRGDVLRGKAGGE